MKQFSLILFFCACVFADCNARLPGQAVCNSGAPCTQSGVAGVCANLALLPGQPIQCGCSVSPIPIPLDNTWMLELHRPGNDPPLPGMLWATTVDGTGPWAGWLNSQGYDNLLDDGILTAPNGTVSFPIVSDGVNHGYTGYIWYPAQFTNGIGNIGPFATSGHLTATIQLTATSDTVFDWLGEDPTNTCTSPVTIRPMISYGATPWYLEWNTGDTGRWWSDTQAVVLSDLQGNALSGTTTITISLDPAQWSGVLGQSAVGDENYAQALGTPHDIGFTIGAGCFFGHGVRTAQGSATISILSFSYSPQ